MCQLLGMNCAQPTDFVFSWSGFAARGGETDSHSDGWGVAFYEGKGCRSVLDDLPSSTSPIAEILKRYPIKTLNMVSHIRKATCGAVELQNVHPFQRELWGRNWVFAHNGDVPLCRPCGEAPAALLDGAEAAAGGAPLFRPVGTTDSEAAFCILLNRLARRFDDVPSEVELFDEVRDWALDLTSRDLGSGDPPILNFLLSNGQHLMAGSWPGARPGSSVWNGLHYVVREPPFHVAELVDSDMRIDFAEVTDSHDCVSVIATVPLTSNEEWVEFGEGEMILFENGRPLHREDLAMHHSEAA